MSEQEEIEREQESWTKTSKTLEQENTLPPELEEMIKKTISQFDTNQGIEFRNVE